MTDDTNTDKRLKITTHCSHRSCNQTEEIWEDCVSLHLHQKRSSGIMITPNLKDTGDDAAQGPDSDAEADQVDAPAVDVRLHLERQQRLNQDVESPDPEGERRTQQVHGEQRGLLLRHTHTHTHRHLLPALHSCELIQDQRPSPGSWRPRTSPGSWSSRAPCRSGSVCGAWACPHPSEPPPVCNARRPWPYLQTHHV